ncbi:alpha/beta fold hydrolase [Aquimarina sp. RZ0]|uniref:alpha/beta fold hydrolase n=1 Tax=Aquimarina sp. RZ0 TaxID=2607730 RepID=UPI0011F3099A|nr:alpha/beta fold hydrolase [Aquimarina sp. RZ0]KAA1243811.1 alpha/beta fold hydrolase [Aquimarina sp. RZ0]
MKKTFIFVLVLCSAHIFGQSFYTEYKEVPSFYSQNEQINEHNIIWGMFTVPENWERPNDNKIKLAVGKLKNTSNKENAEAVVVIEGGPGASAIEGIWWWLNHPLRETHDIVLLDVRGTGFSEPRLCPELGKELLEILAKDQKPLVDEKEKAMAALKCKKSILGRGIDVKNYHSNVLIQDLHALKEYFNYSKWNVYSVSYGTYIAQVYAERYPEDIISLILDSPISDITKYYTLNTTNYISSLENVFKTCREDPNCSKEYPNLEKKYYETIKKLKTNPIKVKVNKEIVASGEFTYNAEDFKIAIHQALYQKRLVEVLPLLINQFYERNEATLSALVAAFSGALSSDYGAYFSVTCNETIPKNSIHLYNEDVINQKSLSEGLSFYKSDFRVCDQWNQGKQSTLIGMNMLSKEIKIPTLIFTGGFDPITPITNGKELLGRIEKAQLIEAASYGHASSFSKIGFEISSDFINNPYEIVENKFDTVGLDFVKDIYINGGVSNMGESLNDFDILFFIPLVTAILICFISVFVFSISFIRKLKTNIQSKIVNTTLIISSGLGISTLVGLIYALQNTSLNNFYVLAFGLSEKFSFLFLFIKCFLILLVLISIYFFFNLKQIRNANILFSVLFSNILIGVYFIYWGFL